MKRSQWIGIVILAALVVLPTGLDDAFTTLPLIAYLGFDGYLKLALIVLAAVIAAGVTWKDIEKAVKL